MGIKQFIIVIAGSSKCISFFSRQIKNPREYRNTGSIAYLDQPDILASIGIILVIVVVILIAIIIFRNKEQG